MIYFIGIGWILTFSTWTQPPESLASSLVICLMALSAWMASLVSVMVAHSRGSHASTYHLRHTRAHWHTALVGRNDRMRTTISSLSLSNGDDRATRLPLYVASSWSVVSSCGCGCGVVWPCCGGTCGSCGRGDDRGHEDSADRSSAGKGEALTSDQGEGVVRSRVGVGVCRVTSVW